MSGNSLVLDTNIVLYLLAGDETIADFLEGKQGYLSVISELELIGYPDITEAELAQIQNFLAGCTIIPVDDTLRSIYTDLRRRYRLRLGDAMAAATAISLDLPFISADKSFSKVSELQFTLYTP